MATTTGTVEYVNGFVIKTEECITETAEVEENFASPDVGGTEESTAFKCYLCGTSMETKVLLMNHLAINHAAQDTYYCDKCDYSVNEITSYNLHLSRHDASTRPFECRICGVRFTGRHGKTQHESSVHGIDSGTASKKQSKKEKTQTCPTCGKMFYYECQLKQHVQVQHRGEKLAKCEVCDKSFANVRNLARHLELHRNETPLATRSGGTTRNTPFCNVCQTEFQRAKDIVTHFEEAHPEQSLKFFPCHDCDEVFFVQASLVTHRNMHSDLYACDQCGKRHYSKQSLAKHRYSAHGIRLDDTAYVKCPVCKKEFVNDGNYTRHLAVHEDVKPFVCDICDKGFRLSDQLRIHMATHSTGNGAPCIVCGKVFAGASSLGRHKKKCLVAIDAE